jgi:D-glycero-alpha-D-manno-heptose-7-phosphate kinase
LLFFYTGLTRSASALLHQQSAKMAASSTKSDAMGERVRLAGAAYADLCSTNIDMLGKYLHDAWQIKKRLTKAITNTLIDDAYQAAIGAGAEGGRCWALCGGGFFMFFAPPKRHDAFRSALHWLRETPFRFAPQGSSIIFVH